jgi:uracil-DNA glycosylase family 4
VVTETQLLQQFQTRARDANLVVDCLPHGDPNSEIVVIAEAPGEREKAMGIPLVGGTGQKLWKEMRAIGIERTQCYVTNVCKRQVSQSTKADVRNPIKSHEGEHWINLLRWELEQLPNKKIILVLGGLALKALFSHESVTAWRGSVLFFRGVPSVITFNPAMVLREPKWEPIFKFDIGKLARVIAGKFRHHAKHDFIYHHSLSPKEVTDHLVRFRDERLPVAFDIETIANETACIGFSNGKKTGVCINFRGVKSNLYSLQEETEIRLKINDLFADPTIKWVAQNGNFDSYWLWYKDRIRVPKIWFDTMTAHHALYPRFPHNLGFLTTQYTDYPYYKEDKTIWREGGDISTFWNYNCDDVIITHEVHERILKELVDQKMDRFYFDHVQKLAAELVLMTVCGVKIDVSLKEELKKSLGEDVEKYEQKFLASVRRATKNEEYNLNYASVPQLAKLLFTDLNLIGRGYSTDQDNRDRMKAHHATSDDARRMLEELDVLKTLDKFKNTYAEMEIDEDNRARCEYRQTGTQQAPGRLSSAKVMWGSGMNLQNQPEKSYVMFIADDGQVFVYNDLSQAEARVVAKLWGVKRLEENFAKAGLGEFDVHRLNASSIFQLPYEAIPEYDRLKLGKTTNDPLKDGEPTMRFIGKRCVHGLNYRMGPEHLGEVCAISQQQAVNAYQRYHLAFPEIKLGWEETIRRVKKDKVIYTPLGRRLLFLEPIYDDKQLDSIIAFVPQSTIGDKVAATIYKCHNDPEWPRLRNGQLVARMALNIHDALISMTPPSEVATVIAITKKYSEEPILINGKELSIPSEFKVSKPDEKGIHRWSTLEKFNVGTPETRGASENRQSIVRAL